MTAVLQSPSHIPPSPPPPPFSCIPNDVPHQAATHIIDDDPLSLEEGEEEPASEENKGERRRRQSEQQLSLLAFLVAVIRKSLVGCSTEKEKGLGSMEISWPTNVRHIAHVTFDRFHGFLGLPAEFEPEVPRKAPSASASVFGVSTKSMQCSYDSRGNSVPTILLLMQRRLYAQGGLQAEGIFRINAENSQEEHVRDLLNHGIVPNGIDVHCLAGLIKAWFRELPTGVLDSLTSEEVMQCQTEKECVRLVKLLPQTEGALLDWAINLMADVVQEEHHNKMNARNVAVVFAPNMTQMVDPLTALMYAVQVMNFLKTLIEKTLRERHESAIEAVTASSPEHSDESGHHIASRLDRETPTAEETEHVFINDEPVLDSPTSINIHVDSCLDDDSMDNSQISCSTAVSQGAKLSDDNQQCEASAQVDILSSGSGTMANGTLLRDALNFHKKKSVRSGNWSSKKGVKIVNRQSGVQAPASSEKFKGVSIMGHINSKAGRVEAWR